MSISLSLSQTLRATRLLIYCIYQHCYFRSGDISASILLLLQLSIYRNDDCSDTFSFLRESQVAQA